MAWRPLEKAAFLVAATGAAAGGGEMLWRASDTWRAGGGLFALAWIGAVLAVGLPLVMLELALATGGRALPAALGPGWRAWVGWFALANAALLVLARLARLASLLPPAAAAGLAVGLGALAVLGARSVEQGRILAFLGAGLLALGTTVALIAATPAGSPGMFALMSPRLGPMLSAEVWVLVATAALMSVPAASGVVGALAHWLPERSRPATQAALAGLVSTALALVGALAGFGLYFGAAAPPPVEAPLGGAFPAAALPRGAAAALGVAMAAGALLLAFAVNLGLRAAAVQKWGGAGGRAAAGLMAGVAVAAAGLALAGAPGQAAAELLSTWAAGVGLPLSGLLICLAARGLLDLPEAGRRLDRAGGLRVGAWLLPAVRWWLPLALAAVLGARVLLAVRAPPGAGVAEALGPLGPLTGALHVAVPVLATLFVVVVSTALHWVAGLDAQRSERRAA